MWFARPFLKLCGFESCPFSAVWITSLGCVAVVFVSLTAAVLIELRIRTDNFQESLGFCVFFSCMQQSRVEKYVLKTYITRWWEKEDWNSWGEGWNSLDYENSLSCPLLGERLKLKNSHKVSSPCAHFRHRYPSLELCYALQGPTDGLHLLLDVLGWGEPEHIAR